MTTNRGVKMKPTERKRTMLDAGLEIATKYGFNAVSLPKVARLAGCSQGLVSHYYETSHDLRQAIMRAAVRKENLRVIADGLAAGNDIARGAPRELRKKALESLMV